MIISNSFAILGAYVLVFGVAALASLASVPRVSRIDDPDTRRGLLALLLTTSGWAAAHVGFLLAPTVELKYALYFVGLVIGISAVGAWLYFCSAFTNRSLHRQATYRRIAVGVFLAIVAVKLTNPLHGLYFTTELVTDPFVHLAVTHGIIHWVTMGLSYGLALVGYFMLFEHVTRVSYDPKPLLTLVGITGLPIVFDVIGFATPYLIDITYEPIGVAIFAVGVAFVYLDQFQAIQLAGSKTEPIVIVDDDGRIRDFNQQATDLFPELSENPVIGEPLADVLPDVVETLERDDSIIECGPEGAKMYYQISESPFSARQATLGRLLVFTDITEREGYRRELERQNERLEQFANMVSHDLRNPLNVAMGRLEIATKDDASDEHLDIVANALDRMKVLVDDLLALARHGQPIDDMESVSLSGLASQSWGMVEAPDADLVVESDFQFEANVDRFQQLLENLFRNAVDHGGDDVTIRVGALDDSTGFYVADDGEGIPAEEREDVIETGYTTDVDGTGFGLAIVSEIVDAHGWTLSLADSEADGLRVEITDL